MDKFAQVHRFRGKVACYLGKGETCYLSPAEAIKLARALRACAQDVAKVPSFADSKVGTFEMHFHNTMGD